jgi:pimeloyl-ACP methyl ester carboxylesterase
VYNIPSVLADLTGFLPQISVPTLVVWGERDQTLTPTSFTKMVKVMPHAIGKSMRAGHVPHQSNVQEFNQMALEFIRGLD